jgi:hypothetical protein
MVGKAKILGDIVCPILDEEDDAELITANQELLALFS